MLYNQILSKRNQLNKQIQLLEKELSTLPTGSLCCIHDKNRIKYYCNNSDGIKYLSKEEQKLKEQLANKKYLSLLLKDYYQEQKALNAYLKLHKHEIGQKAHDLLAKPEYKSLLTNYFQPLSEELYNWKNEPYDKSSRHPEHLTHSSLSGNIVRSKSESIIDMLLFLNKIPYRYECALYFPECTIYPDFTIRHPKTGKTYFWEHFGLMDDPSYSKNAYSKIQLYISHQIMPGENLIMTFETKHCPLTTNKIDQIINQYFL